MKSDEKKKIKHPQNMPVEYSKDGKEDLLYESGFLLDL